MADYGKYAEEIAEVDKVIAETAFPDFKSTCEKYRKSLVAKADQESRAASIAASTTASSSVNSEPVVASASVPTPSTKVAVPIVGQYIPITDFSWDQGGYNTNNLSIYIDLPNVGSAKDRVNCNFGRHSIDLTVADVDGKNYRLVNNNLEKDIVPGECKYIVKKDKIVLKLIKAKGEHSYENWNQLSAKKPRDAVAEANKKKDPQSSLMDMMKDLYEDGDANMKKVIGEAMMKSQRGEKSEPPSMPSLGKGKKGAASFDDDDI